MGKNEQPRQSRIYTPQPLGVTSTIELTGPVRHYVVRVLRSSEGDSVTMFNGDGNDYLGEICEIEDQHLLVKVLGKISLDNESPLKITLVQAISRGERMNYSLQKATELGVVCIQLVISRRVEVRLDEKRQTKRLAHWRGVVVSACEQSGRAVVPEVRVPLTLDEWSAADDVSQQLVLDPMAKQKLSSCPIVGESVSILVGPEGGFSKEELQDLQAKGVTAVSLGPRVLRTETAGPVAIAVLQAMAGDF